MEALQTAYPSFTKNLTVIRTEFASQINVMIHRSSFCEASCHILQYGVQSSFSITGEVNTTADTLLDANDKIFVRVITAQAQNKTADFFRL
jgi:hypothetical protein